MRMHAPGRTLILLFILCASVISGCSSDSPSSSQGADLPKLPFWVELYSEDTPLFLNSEALARLKAGVDEWIARGRLTVRDGRLFKALIDQLETHRQTGSLEALGLQSQFRAWWYLRDWWPVFQWQLADGTRFQQMLDDLPQRTGEQWDQATYRGLRFYRSRGVEIQLLWLVHDDHFVLAWVPRGLEQALLDTLLDGRLLLTEVQHEQAGENRVGDDRTRGRHGISGWVDSRSLLVSLTTGHHVQVRRWRRWLEVPEVAASLVCQRELAQWTDLYPGIHFRQTDDEHGNRQVQLLLRQAPVLSGKQLRMVGAFLSPPERPALLQMQLALNVEQFATELQAWLQDHPRWGECHWLDTLHQTMAEMHLAYQHRVVPGLVRQLQGVGLALYASENELRPETVSAMLWLRTQQPETIFNLAALFEPALADIRLEADGKAHPLPREVQFLQRKGQPSWIARRGDYLGFAVGEGMKAKLEQRLRAEPQASPVALWVQQDLQRVFSLMRKEMIMLPGMQGGEPALQEIDRLASRYASVSLQLEPTTEGLSLTVHLRGR